MASNATNFTAWTNNRTLQWIGTNSGSDELPFQKWHHFKEAFAPELLERAVNGSLVKVKSCLDPFGGSGTTALACQFLGVEPTIIEVNPYLCDLIEAKLASYDSDTLAKDFGYILSRSRTNRVPLEWSAVLPPTFIEPGKGDRWLFNKDVAQEILQLRKAIGALSLDSHRKFFTVQLGGILGTVSNIRTSGKGRRYRSNWKQRSTSAALVRDLFSESCERAILEVHRFARRPMKRYRVVKGDSREVVGELRKTDLIVFSPPYPNSFDYTDVYNVELWMLGYLACSDQNRSLRTSTLSSHVQIKRNFSVPPPHSRILNKTLRLLEARGSELWSQHLPAMVGSYFAELAQLFTDLYDRLNKSGSMWIVVGDSQYGGVRIDVAGILTEFATKLGYTIRFTEPFRSMRSSPQQGGREELPETLLVFDKC